MPQAEPVYYKIPLDYYARKNSTDTGMFSDDDNIAYVSPDLRNVISKYRKIKDCLDGNDAVKARRDIYLPKPNSSDTSSENEKRYCEYIQRAVFYSVLEQTSLGLIGQCYIYDPIVEIPKTKELDRVIKNVDGETDIYQFSRKALATNVNYSRAGLLVDYPKTPENSSIADNEKVDPSIILYQPEQIINVKEKMRNGKKIVWKIVIYECQENNTTSYSDSYKETWRELILINNPETSEDEYHVRLWEFNKEQNKYGITETIKILVDNKPLDFIPFVFLGSTANTSKICNPQLYAMACLNIAHYINSADYEDSCYMVGQPTPVFTGVTESWLKKILNGVIRIGSRASVSLPVGGTAMLLQAKENIMPIEAMKHKENQMVSLGAKLIQPSTIVRTATESTMEKSDENSILTCTSKNVSVGIEQCLKWCYMFKTGKREGPEIDAIKFELRTESTLANMTANERKQAVVDWHAGAITYKELRTAYKKAGIAYENIDNPPPPPPQAQMKIDGIKPAQGAVNMANGKDLAGNSNNS